MLRWLKRKDYVVRIDVENDVLVLTTGYSSSTEQIHVAEMNVATQIAKVAQGRGFQIVTIPQGMNVAGVIHVGKHE